MDWDDFVGGMWRVLLLVCLAGAFLGVWKRDERWWETAGVALVGFIVFLSISPNDHGHDA